MRDNKLKGPDQILGGVCIDFVDGFSESFVFWAKDQPLSFGLDCFFYGGLSLLTFVFLFLGRQIYRKRYLSRIDFQFSVVFKHVFLNVV